jgi:anhydro-N-acetylmuramic acid kinase
VGNASEPGHLYIGLMSGTSMDGIDAALVRLGDRQCEILATCSHPYPPELRRQLLKMTRGSVGTTLDQLGQLDTAIGACFRDAALAVLSNSNTTPASVTAIGSHGQTIRHLPEDSLPFTMQVGDPNLIAQGTGITTIADFRRRDLAAGGQGAPLAPAFHEWLFGGHPIDRVVLNLGGFANITILPADKRPVTGFDTGPANSLLDAWINRHRSEPFDSDGQWARSGRASDVLLARLLNDEYFSRPPPKSTGFEYFNLDWLQKRVGGADITAADVQATLLQLSVRTIASAIETHAPSTAEILACGGGTHNSEFMRRLAEAVEPITVQSTATCGLDPDWVEAAAFAWLASRTLQGLPGNLPSVTGATRPEVLGGIYLCAS